MSEIVIESSRRQRKNFNQRVSYWVKQGLNIEEASRLALVKEQMITSSAANLEVASDPPPPQRALGQIYNFPQPNLKPDRKSDSQETIPHGRESGRSLNIRPSEALEQVFCLLMVIGTSIILIKASWQVFGAGWEGFLKAFLLESGILTLSVYRGRKILGQMVSKTGAIALACLSLFVLHTGVEGAQASALRSAGEVDSELSALKAQRDRLLTLQDDLPLDHLKRREGILGSVRDLTTKIEQAKVQFSASQTTKTIRNQHTLETLIRIALMYLGTMFAHHLVSRIKEVNFWVLGGHQAL